jgi:hypothetical protein
MSDASDAAVSFAMHCDMSNLSYEAGLRLAREIGDELVRYAEERRSIPGVVIEAESGGRKGQ